jgi:O-antigen ligase
MSRAKEAALPFYLLLCILLGGSSQAIWGNALLQLLAIGLLAWAALTRDPAPITTAGRRLLLIVAIAILLVMAQLILLPPAVWTELPGREFIADGYALLDMPLPWLPISEAPYDTMSTALTLLPPLALLIAMLRLQHWRVSWLFGAVFVATAISVFLGALQVSAGDGNWYFYRRTNLGVAVGPFANGNHLATMLLAAIPLLTALVVQKRRLAAGKGDRSIDLVLGVAAGCIILIGLLINRSAAMVILGPAVVAATAVMAMRLSPRRKRQGMLLAIGLLAAAAAVVVLAGKSLPSMGTTASIETRGEYWSTSLPAVQDQWLTGSGFGTFVQTYRRYEDPQIADRWFTNHAHNDYLELAIEGGAAALLVLLAFLLWWAGRARDSWSRETGTIEQKAAAVASAAILLHSLFDYPLRTAGIAAIFAVCLALLAGARGAGSRAAAGSEQARHATL